MENEEQYKLPEQSKKQDSNPEEQERMDILRRAAEIPGKQLRIDIPTGNLQEVDELREAIGKEFENPEEKYNAYYNGIEKVLKAYLPKGKEFSEAKRIIRDEVYVFLNLGKKKSDNNGIRKSDARMTFQPIMNEMVDLLIKWVAESQNPFALYNTVYDLNEKHDYGHEAYDQTSQNFANAMRKLKDEDLG